MGADEAGFEPECVAISPDCRELFAVCFSRATLISLFWHKDDSLRVTREGDGYPLDRGRLPPDDKQAGQDHVEDGRGIAPTQPACSAMVHGGSFADFFGERGSQSGWKNQQTYKCGGCWSSRKGKSLCRLGFWAHLGSQDSPSTLPSLHIHLSIQQSI